MSCWKLKEDGGEDWVWCGKGEKREGKWLEEETREFRVRVKEESMNGQNYP